MTLVEILIAFGILMAGLVCIFGFLLAGTAQHRRAIKETEATMIAGSILADLRGEFARGYIPRGNNLTYEELKDHPGYTYNAAVINVDPKKGEDREYFVRVRVRWSEKGDNQFIEFSTVMCNGKLKKEVKPD